MTVAIERISTPVPGANYAIDTGHRKLGLGIAAVGLMLSMIVAIIGVVVGTQIGDAGSEVSNAQALAVAFGLNTLGLATLKSGIAVILVGILVRLWFRVESIKASLPAFATEAKSNATPKTATPFGEVNVSTTEPDEMPIHKVAKTMWAPMLVMGYMLVVVGLVTSFVWAGNIGTDLRTATGASAWTQGLQFLGEAFVLAGISFLLASILRGLRQGGGQVQQALGVPVQTLKMPASAKGFIALMIIGVMVALAQFVGYITVTTFDDAARAATWFAFLGPLREFSLALLLSGIVLALATIGKVLGFQFWRIRSIITQGL
jgi:hypothetical protein